jgi:hypothetical protein
MIRRVVGAMLTPVRRFLRGDHGGGAIELVLVLPIAMAVFMAAMESALYMTRSIMLERAVDMTVRDLRLGGYANPDAELLKDEICRRTSVTPDCRRDIRIEMRAVSTTAWDFPATAIRCIDREEAIVPADDANPGAQNELMLIRVCVRQRAMFPGTGIGDGLTDGRTRYKIVAVSAFVNEPS